ncbi:hypothetical protein [Dyella acidiphila]|uniref:Vitamin B12 transport system permease protein n=1 Tax=Dyella acidiphila TaxID=2775866 RepID=A0ABR9G3Y7_9GAMM|nr:hypothetical protein [Dyella acidiphila]MBE1158771.1 hypothetical protein [Dyella acidiphila]
MTARQIIGECFALLCAVMLGLAAGAVWLLPTVYLQRPLRWLAVLAGWLLGAAVRQWVHGRGWHAGVLAAVATVVASAYIHVLIATVNISAMMGYGLLDTMHTAGLSMLLDMARIGVRLPDLAWTIAGIAAALINARRAPRRKTRAAD